MGKGAKWGIGCFGILAFFYIVGTVGSSGSSPSGPAATTVNQLATDTRMGSIKVDRVWEDYGWLHALVSYTNDTSRTFSSLVTIQCVAMNGTQRVATNDRSFFARERGVIAPGFSATIEVPVDLSGAASTGMTCNVSAAR